MKAVVKDPSERLDFVLDLINIMTIDEDTISAHDVALPATPTGLTLDTDQHTDTEVIAWLSAGTAGSDYPVVFQATTIGGRVHERTLLVRVRNR